MSISVPEEYQYNHLPPAVGTKEPRATDISLHVTISTACLPSWNSFCWCFAFHLVHNWMLTPLFQILWNILLHDAGSNTYRAVADSYIPVIHITALYLLFMLYIPLKVEFLNHKAILSLFYLFNKYKLIFSICYFKGVR